MVEIEALRALVDEQGGGGPDQESMNEIENLRRQLTDANDRAKSSGDLNRSKNETLIAELRAEI